MITSCQLLGYGSTNMKILATCKDMMNMYFVLCSSTTIKELCGTEYVTHGTIHNKYILLQTWIVGSAFYAYSSYNSTFMYTLGTNIYVQWLHIIFAMKLSIRHFSTWSRIISNVIDLLPSALNDILYIRLVLSGNGM